MEQTSLNLVIVGHVDHGKSTLIGRLLMDTGTLPEEKVQELREMCKAEGKEFRLAFVMDQFEEERKFDMTIDTTQTFFRTAAREYVIIDAPGHREFLKNMITGASLAHAAVLIVSAREGIEDQTRRHGYLLGLLGIEQIIVVVNKMDLMDYDEAVFQSTAKAVTELLDQMGAEPMAIIPISAEAGDNVAARSDNMPWYTGPSFLDMLDSLEAPVPDMDKPMRFAVQDVYEVDGETVLVGRTESGKVRPGSKIKTLPLGQDAEVKALHIFGEEPTELVPGQCAGVSLSPALDIGRGAIIADAASPPAVTRQCHAKIFWLGSKGYRVGRPIAMRCATQEVPCKIERIERRFDCSNLGKTEEGAEEMGETDIGEVVITTDEPIVLERFEDIPELGRFTLVEGENVLAGGIVTDPK
ncbi:MAG: GTP-binding protein [Planctomycetes bacterium]|nr:GTP-binding protein [Planctomycetota bacterium]